MWIEEDEGEKRFWRKKKNNSLVFFGDTVILAWRLVLVSVTLGNHLRQNQKKEEKEK
jgi:hypothetical protein